MTSPTEPPAPAVAPARSRARRLFRFFFFLGAITFLVALLGVGLAPVLLGTAPGRAAGLFVANLFLPVEVRASSLGFSWKRGVSLRGLRIGRQGEDSIEIDTLKASVHLADLARRRLVAEAHVSGLRATLTRREEGTIEAGGRAWRREPDAPRGRRGGEDPWSFEVALDLADAQLRLVDEVRSSEATVRIDRLSAATEEREARVRLETEGSVDAGGLAGSFAIDAWVDPEEGDGEGTARLRGLDLASLAPFLAAASPLAGLEGVVEGRLDLASGETVRASGEWRATGLRLPGRPEEGIPEVVEEEATVEFSAFFDREADRVVLERAEVAARSSEARVRASGVIEEATGARLLAGTIEIDADGGALRRAAGAALPAELGLEGAARAKFSLGGALETFETFSASGTVVLPDVSFGENSLRGGRAEIALTGAAVRLRELRGTWNGGELLASGLADLSGEEPRIAFEARADDVRIVRDLVLPLAHVLPVLATPDPRLVRVSVPFSGEVRVAGTGSASLCDTIEGEGRVELKAGTLEGSPDVLPLLRALGGRDSLAFDGMSTTFRIAQGRITTEALRIGRGDAVVTLAGSTGLDGTLDYRVAVDLSEKIERRRWGAVLEGLFGSAGLPVGLAGRVDAPRVELRPLDLEESAGDAAREGARTLLEEILKKRKY